MDRGSLYFAEFRPSGWVYQQVPVTGGEVLPFEAGAHPGLDPFTLLQFDARLPDTLFLDADRGAFTMITGDDPQVAKYVQDFEDLIEDAWSAESSIEFMRKVADEMS